MCDDEMLHILQLCRKLKKDEKANAVKRLFEDLLNDPICNVQPIDKTTRIEVISVLLSNL